MVRGASIFSTLPWCPVTGVPIVLPVETQAKSLVLGPQLSLLLGICILELSQEFIVYC